MRIATRALLLLVPLLVVSACSDDPQEGVDQNPDNSVPVEVKEIKPTGGPIAGGTAINVYGSGFKDGAKVFLGDKEATQVVVVSPIRITAKTPAAAAARVDVKVVNPDGKQASLVGAFIYEGQQQPTVGQAEVYNETHEVVSTGAPISELVRGAVQVAGITRGAGQGAGVRAQVGYAPAEANLMDMASYTWADAVYDTDSESGEADIYKGTVSLLGPTGEENREWVVTLRFSVDGGTTWVMADRDGVANGITELQLPRVFVGKPRVDWCKLGDDGNNSTPLVHYKPGQTELTKIRGQVFAAGVTNNGGQGAGVVGEIGWGPDNTDPRTSNQWIWSPATFKRDVFSNDEYEATLPHPGAVGTYKFAVRFNISNGRVRYCDSDGTNDSAEGELAFSLGKLGTLVVSNEAPKLPVEWCKLGDNDIKDPQTVNYAVAQTGDKTIVAQVFMTGVTDKVGAGQGLTGQLGWGPANEDPRTSNQWNWNTQLAFNQDRFGANDEWKAVLPNPAKVGNYKFAVRFAVDGGPVRVCDSDGHNDTNQGELSFSLDKLGILNVQGEVELPKVVGYCKLGPDGNKNPEALEYTVGQPASSNRKVLGSVWVDGATQGIGQGSGITAELGWGPADKDPRDASSGWQWTAAGYKGDIGDASNPANDEYEATLPNPDVKGSYKLAYRFKANGGEFRYCDADGATGATEGEGAFDLAKLSTLSVVDAAAVAVDWCKLGGESGSEPWSEVYRVGEKTLRTVYAQVYKAGVTDKAGADARLTGELGWGPVDQDPSTTATTDWKWSAATFNKDTGNNSNDEFQASLPNPNTVGQYKFAYRFRIGTGEYRYCDADGLAEGGFTLAKASNLEVKPVGVDACQLIGPATLSATPGATTAPVRGKVRVTTVTDTTSGSAAAGITAQVGFGPSNSDPATAGGWMWKDAGFTGEGDDGATDLYEVALTAPDTQGSYAVAIRFAYQGGAPVYCDRDGSGNGYQTAQASTLTVATLPTVDWCKLGGSSDAPPPSESALVGDPASKLFYAQLFESGVTDKTGAGEGLAVEIGYGPAGEQPETNAWTWTAATYNVDIGNNDEFKAALPIPATPGAYKFAFRARLGNGPFAYCDADGLDKDGFTLAQAGSLTVSPAGTALCRLRSVSTDHVMSGGKVTTVGRVRVPGVTDGDGAGAGLRVQVGLGDDVVDASTTPAAFTWKDATYAIDPASDVNTDEYTADLWPAYTSQCSETNTDCARGRALSLRYSRDNGTTWAYCDSDGSDVGGYTLDRQPALTVTKHTDIGYCNLQWPFSMSVTSADRNVYGQVSEDGVTSGGGQGAGIVAELGYGDPNQDPGVAWTWASAAYNKDEGNNDEYVKALPENLPVGTGYVYRYSLNGGPYCYGAWKDMGGSGFWGGGFRSDSVGTVSP